MADQNSEKPQVMSGGNDRRNARTEAANERALKNTIPEEGVKTQIFEKDSLGRAGDTVLENQEKINAEEKRQKDMKDLADKIMNGGYR